MSGRLVITTPRLQLRELAAEDAPLALAVLNTEGFLRHVGDRGLRDVAGAMRYLEEGPLASYAAHGYGMWKVELRDTGEAIGLCGLLNRPTLPAPDVGYAYLPGHAGRGLATEAAAAVLRHGLDVLGLPRILAIVAPGNQASIRVLEKIGMRSEGLQPLHDTELEVYAIGATSATP